MENRLTPLLAQHDRNFKCIVVSAPRAWQSSALLQLWLRLLGIMVFNGSCRRPATKLRIILCPRNIIRMDDRKTCSSFKLANTLCCAVATLAARLQRVLSSQYMVTEPQIKQPEELAAQEPTTEQVRARMP